MRTKEFIPTVPARRRGGITESKKAELDSLTNQVLDAQFRVEQMQAIVDSLTTKSAQFSGFLAVAAATQTKTLANRDLVIQIVQNARDLVTHSKTALSATASSDTKTKELAKVMKDLVDKVIFSAEVVNKLANLVIRKKVLNPLISDDLVKMVGIAGTDANSAVALTLVALQASFTAQAATLETEATSALEYIESVRLYTTLSGMVEKLGGIDIASMELGSELLGTLEYIKITQLLKGLYVEFVQGPNYDQSLLALVIKNYNQAAGDYTASLAANEATLAQLNVASSDLARAQNKLKSLQSGLAAANAAALAS